MTSTTTPSSRSALEGVRVWTGHDFSDECTVIIDGSVVGTADGDAEVIDCAGGYLMPGLIDAHVHLADHGTLDRLADFGVTTALDMATWPPERLNPLRNVSGTTDIRSPGAAAIGPAGPHSHMPVLSPDAVLHTPADARAFVRARADEGVDYIKIVLEAPGEGGPDHDTAATLVQEAHTIGKAVVAHAASIGAFSLALDIDSDVVTHVPLGEPLPEALAKRAADQGVIAVPTLTMMEGVSVRFGGPDAFKGALQSVTRLRDAGVTILAGTDANSSPGVPAQIPHGESLHRELALLIQAGLDPVEALNAATSLPAKHFGLHDRGTIDVGQRADLILLNANPLHEIRATRDIVRTWFAGVERRPNP